MTIPLGEETTRALWYISFLFIVLFAISRYLKYGRRKNSSMTRKILDALIEYGCVEEPPIRPRTASAREVAHLIYNRDVYMKDPHGCDYQTARCMIKMEKSGDLGNSGETTDDPEIAMKKGSWYIKWHFPSE